MTICVRQDFTYPLNPLGIASSSEPAYAYWEHFVPPIMDARISNTAVSVLNMPNHLALESMTCYYRFAYSASETACFFFFFSPEHDKFPGGETRPAPSLKDRPLSLGFGKLALAPSKRQTRNGFLALAILGI